MPLPFEWPWYPFVSLIESLFWLIGVLGLAHFITRIAKGNALVVSLVWIFVAGPIMLTLFAIIWGGDFVLWIWDNRVLWVGMNRGWTFQLFGIGPNDSCALFRCRRELIPKLGGLAWDQSHLAMLLVLAGGGALYNYFARHLPQQSSPKK